MEADNLKHICDLTVRLTELRLKGCGWLCIENYAPEVFAKLVAIYEGRVEISPDSVAGLVKSLRL